eukprot:TRINITY_DN2336_c0_g2_i1.p1 TRINITY_DN2336_c0_g2~~TRINITY_DN2336_c0_g2_i1.p1  ORF type:complete len:159 (+),score=36.58 TRINITY_DN2336_c0_g2_i1:1112-1588(+)
MSEQLGSIKTLMENTATLRIACVQLQAEYKDLYCTAMGLQSKEGFLTDPSLHPKLVAKITAAQHKLSSVIALKGIKVRAFASLPTTVIVQQQQQQQLGPQQQPSGECTQLCIFCDERPRSVRFHPCGHGVLCSQCSELISKCPMCRRPITEKQKLFMS